DARPSRLGCGRGLSMVRSPIGIVRRTGGPHMLPNRMVAISAVLLVVAMAGCEAGGMQMGTGTATGGLGGAAAGGLLGAALGGGSAGIASGVLLGGLLGAGVGQMLGQQRPPRESQARPCGIQYI